MAQRDSLSLNLVSVTSNVLCPGRQRSEPEPLRLPKGSRRPRARLGGAGQRKHALTVVSEPRGRWVQTDYFLPQILQRKKPILYVNIFEIVDASQ